MKEIIYLCPSKIEEYGGFWEMTKKRILLLCLFVILLIPAKTFAYSSIAGPSGLLTIPTPDVTREGIIDFGVGFVDDDLNLTVSYGLIQDLEVSLKANAYGNKVVVLPQFKFQLLNESKQEPGISIGYDGSSIYAVVGKTLSGTGVRGHVGVSSGNQGGIFLGLEKVLNPVRVKSTGGGPSAPVTVLMLEYNENRFNIGARFIVSSAVYLDLGVVDLSEFTGKIGIIKRF